MLKNLYDNLLEEFLLQLDELLIVEVFFLAAIDVVLATPKIHVDIH